MKTVLKQILQSYKVRLGNGEIFRFSERDGYLYAIVYDVQGKESDFFLFSFQNSLPDIDYQSLSIVFSKFALLPKDDDSNVNLRDEKGLGSIPAFDKNLNLIVFCEITDDMNIDDALKISAYRIEEDPYFFKKKVIFHTRRQVEGFDNPNLSVSNGFQEIEQDILDSKKRFILNLLIGLSFIRVDFGKKNTTENNIYQSALRGVLAKTYDCLDEKLMACNDFGEFNAKLRKLSQVAVGLESVQKDRITKLEQSLLDMFAMDGAIGGKILSNASPNGLD